MNTMSVTWSPDLHKVVRSFKKKDGAKVAQVSQMEQKAIDASFSKNVQKSEIGPLSSWG